jgi:hypothetical protein
MSKPEIVFKWRMRNNGKRNMLVGIAVQPLFLSQAMRH